MSTDIGKEYEYDMEDLIGLERVPGSGNGWAHKLDVKGRGTRWSLKATSKSSFRVGEDMIAEAIRATAGIGGTGETPVWGVRTSVGDFVIMRTEDWIRFMKSDVFSIPLTKSEERRARAQIPELFRNE